MAARWIAELTSAAALIAEWSATMTTIVVVTVESALLEQVNAQLVVEVESER